MTHDAGTAGASAAAGRPARLKRRPEFLAAAKGRRASAPGLALQVLRRDDGMPARFGFTVTKKVGNAVVRNRARRRLRAAAGLVAAEGDVGSADIVLIGRDGTCGRDFRLLLDDLRGALAKAGAGTAAPSGAGSVAPSGAGRPGRRGRPA